MRIKNSVVVITGATSGIGRATTLRFVKQGARVVVSARDSEALDSLVDECRRRGAQALAVPADMSDAAEVDVLARRAVDRFDRLDIWVNNAGIGVFAPFLEMPLADIRRVLDVDIMGVVHGAKAALHQMRKQGAGVLINVSSVSGVIAQPYTAAYSMSKAAVRALGTSLRSELELAGVDDLHVVTVMPAAVDTPFFDHVANYTGQDTRPIPPVYSPDKIAAAIVDAARSPRRELTVGLIAKSMVLQHKLLPAATERLMGTMSDRFHLNPKQPTADTEGNLYESAGSRQSGEITGGAGGRTKTMFRRAAAVGAAAGLAAIVLRRTWR